MLTSLRFKNWRSLRDVTINNLTPITVFIGANSAGKSNIIDALHFLRFSAEKGVFQAIRAWGGLEKIRWHQTSPQERIRIELEESTFSSMFWLEIDSHEKPTSFGSHNGYRQQGMDDRAKHLITRRWQLLREQLTPKLALNLSDLQSLDAFVLDPVAAGLTYVLDVMREFTPMVYDQLQLDLGWLLEPVQGVSATRESDALRMVVTERWLGGKEALTISAGTLRIIAMLTAHHALDMIDADQPGLIVLEEPDAFVHPLLLSRLVEQMRTYVDREGHPRQFIITTHNPMLLNLFNPEEVRIVERDEKGETHVKPVNMDIAKIWLEQDGAYNLGNMWTTRALGGVPE